MSKHPTYTQPQKNKVRHESLFHAINLLTTNRNNCCCVDRNYVRNIYDYFNELDECKDNTEVSKINVDYIKSWEKLHDSFLGSKRPEDLVVCYLSGPEPQNDFNELVSLGIHPQNIWAFESNTNTYLQAIQNYDELPFPQPKIVKGSIEHFFKCTPKKFDIIYIDACGTIVSNQHVLRIISSLFKYHRLNSPGIVITNFAAPEITKENEIDEYSKLMAQYLNFKDNLSNNWNKNMQLGVEDQILALTETIKTNFDEYYSEFITRVLMDIPSVIVPSQRFVNSQYLNMIINDGIIENTNVNFNLFNETKNNSILKFMLFNHFLGEGLFSKEGIKCNKTKILINEFSGLDQYPIDIFSSILSLSGFKNGRISLKSDIQDIKEYFDQQNNEIYQFLDVPNSNLFFDLIVNQLSYPMHYNTTQAKRFKYKAKNTTMFTDVFAFDECRYIYEWLPTIHLIKNAFKDISWQYTFRFALDGLVKHRIKYNNEYFFQGSVINKKDDQFGEKKLNKRVVVK